MKTTCIDPEVGRLAARYEAGRLSPDEAARYEEHLIACGACFADAEEMQPLVSALQRHAEQFLPHTWASVRGRWGSFWRRFKEEVMARSRRGLRTGLAAAACALAVSILWVGGKQETGEDQGQTMLVRGSAQTLRALAPNGEIDFVRPLFRFAPPAGREGCRIVIWDEEGNQIYRGQVSEGEDSVQYPADAPPLLVEQTYLWLVQAPGEGPARAKSPLTSFTVAAGVPSAAP